jgi:hypothetical protein
MQITIAQSRKFGKVGCLDAYPSSTGKTSSYQMDKVISAGETAVFRINSSAIMQWLCHLPADGKRMTLITSKLGIAKLLAVIAIFVTIFKERQLF